VLTSRPSLSIYETRLRDVLKLRKKLKKEDWKSIHNYVISRDMNPGEYDVLLNGTPIPEKKVWKEIRRNGYHTHQHVSNDITLPKDVHIRPRTSAITMKAMPSATVIIRNQSLSTIHSQSEKAAHQGQPLQTWDGFSAALDACESFTRGLPTYAIVGFQTTDPCPRSKVIEKFHESMPWNQFRISLLEHIL
jgi:hypothetical protein